MAPSLLFNETKSFFQQFATKSMAGLKRHTSDEPNN